MRVSVLASVCVGVLALMGAPAVADISDLQCHSGNSNSDGVCTPNQNPAEQFRPTYNKQDAIASGISFEVDRLYLKALINTTSFPTQFDADLKVHRIIWGTNTQNGLGNSQRNVSQTIGRVLPAGFIDFPFQMAYRADGFYLEPEPTAGDSVTGTNYDFNYKLKDNSAQGGVNQPAQVSGGYSELRMLFQPYGGFGFTAGSPMSVSGQTDVFADGNTLQFGPLGTLPNAGVGTYYQTRRVISTAGGEQLTGNLTVQSGTTLQSVGGANAPGNTYNVQAVQGAYDAPVLSNMVTPQADGAFVTFQLAPLAGATPATGKVFISQAILTVKSVTPVDGSTTGVPFVGTYTLDISSNTVATSTYVAGSQKLYVRATGSNTWTALSGSTLSNNAVSYTLQSSDVPAASAASLDMAVQADAPPPPVPSSSTGPSSSSSSSTAPAVVSSSSSSTAPAVPSSSSAVPSSSTAAPSSSSSAVPSSSTAAPAASSSSSSSTGAAAPVSSSSSSSTAVPVPVVSSSSSSSGAASSSSSSSTAEDNGTDGGAASVAANGVAVVLAAAAAVAALYA